MKNLKDECEGKIKQLKDQNDHPKQQLEKEEGLNDEHSHKIITIEQNLEDFQLVSITSPFSKFIKEEFKQPTYRIHDDLHQGMVSLFEGLNEMQEIYNTFEHHSYILYGHTTRAYDTLVDWMRYIKDKTDDLPVLDKGNFKRIQVSIEAWESVFHLV